MEVQEIKEQLKNMFRTVLNSNPNVKEHEEMNVENDKWITIHPNGEDGKGRPLLLKDGETPKEAIDRVYTNKKIKATPIIKKGNQIEIGIRTNKGIARVLGKRMQIDGIDVVMHKRDKDWDMSEYALTDFNTGMQLATLDKEDLPKFTFKKVLDRYKEEIKKYPTINIDNSKETEMALLDELKKLITKVENDKGEENMTIENEKVDKRKLIDEVGGILKGKVDDEVIRTIIGKMEKMSYDKSEAGTADNEKEVDNDTSDTKKSRKDDDKNVKNEDKEPEKDKKEVDKLKKDEKKEVDNKCDKKADNSVDNSKPDYFGRLNEIYNAATSHLEEKSEYVSRADREKAAEDYFTRS